MTVSHLIHTVSPNVRGKEILAKATRATFLSLLAISGLLLFCSDETGGSLRSFHGDTTEGDNYLAGRRLGAALFGRGPCSAAIGNVKFLDEKRLLFSTKENLLGEGDLRTFAINYKRISADSNPEYGSAYPWIFVEDSNPDELLFVECGGTTKSDLFSFSTADKKLFPSVRRCIKYFIDYKKDPSIVLEIPNLVKTESDVMVAGYLIEFVAGGGVLEHPDYMVLVLTQLLESEKVRDVAMVDIDRQLGMLLSGSFVFPISEQTRENGLRNLISSASSGKRFALSAIVILARIADEGRVDLKSYISVSDKVQLLQNLDAIPLDRLPKVRRAKLQALLVT
jgi:hypothetical protein